ncbi:hypothetical protein FSARC_1150 [Fusarium sarcochroum]|uniref:Uncharacterized protein n=1 Tax=Fusarium sarcochroum TaxID=1208366 RepID=A0A8H4U9D9_9HYPO|nr:hypothetical protein FSARC_1150 [Fusarium sarcochroum]
MSHDQPKRPVVCVFCGASGGKNPVHLEAARSLATQLHKKNALLVYGGGTVGMMGHLAQTLVSLAGPDSVHGVIPKALVRVEEGYKDNGEAPVESTTESGAKVERIVKGNQATTSEFGLVTVVPDMHTRKQTMAKMVFQGGVGSGFIALAGGFGTMEELMEMTTWNQLGIHRVGVLLLNINGYWNAIVEWVKNAVEEGFLSPENAGILIETSDVAAALEMLRDYQVSRDRLELSWGNE